jgi:hypothetical protein
MAAHPVEPADAPPTGWLTREDPEWERAWHHFPDPVMAHPVSGECLQYMGSVQEPGRGWVHVFRHRQVPGSGQRQVWRVPASVGWAPCTASVSPPPAPDERRPDGEDDTGDDTGAEAAAEPCSVVHHRSGEGSVQDNVLCGPAAGHRGACADETPTGAGRPPAGRRCDLAP